MIVVRAVEWAEQALGAGEIGCPHLGCGGTLTRWGYGRRRRVRRLGAQILDVRPRRARCTRCASTQILLPASVQPRLADTTEVIGTALASKADGHGHRRIATELDRSPSTVRRWMRRATRNAHLQWLRQRGRIGVSARCHLASGLGRSISQVVVAGLSSDMYNS